MENVFIGKIKDQARNLKVLSEELKVQMALGKAEARDLIEKEKKVFSDYINTQRQEIAKLDKAENETRRTFLSCVEDLETILYSDVPEDPKAYDAYKDSILNKVYKLEEEVRDNYPDLSSKMQDKMDDFKAKMDAFRVNLALHDKDDPEKVEKVKAEFTEKLEEIRKKLSSKEVVQTKLDNFVEDISESFDYLKRAIADLSN